MVARAMDLPVSGHDPVLMDQVLEGLAIAPGQTVVDCTLGRAGHASAIASRLGSAGVLIGLDADPRNLAFAAQRLGVSGASATSSLHACTIRLFHANFAQLDDVLEQVQPVRVDAILADLGLSTNQLFDISYGLSFAQDMPLDMRLDPELPTSAQTIVNHMPERELADCLFNLAQERYSRRIARKIVEARRISPIQTTERLADIVRRAVGPGHGGPGKIDPATRTFLALRMVVNREVEHLARLLEEGPALLSGGGRMGVISFQSTEDRAVKQAFRSLEQTGLYTVLTKKPLSPSPAELAANPRSRSAKLRIIQRT